MRNTCKRARPVNAWSLALGFTPTLLAEKAAQNAIAFDNETTLVY